MVQIRLVPQIPIKMICGTMNGKESEASVP